MICALIIAFTINIGQVEEASNKLDTLITSAITKPAMNYEKDIEYIRSIIKYIQKNNTVEDLDSAKVNSVISIYEQILYEVEYYQKNGDERLIKSIITNKIIADNILNTINKKGS